MNKVWVLGVLLGIMVGLGWVAQSNGTTTDTLAATGFILLAAYTCGALFKRIGLPALLGYLVAGIAFGPKLAALLLGGSGQALFGEGVIGDLKLINTLAIGVIGTMGGGELKISDVRRNFKEIAVVSMFSFWGVVLAVFGVLLVVMKIAPSLIPFVDTFGSGQMWGVLLMMSILAAGMSPSATLAMIQELKAKGQITSLILGIVVVADIVLVATFLFGVSLTELLVSPAGFAWSGLAGRIPLIMAEFGYALVIGGGLGGIFILYLRFVKREMLLFSVGMIFAASYISKILHAETLLAFLTAGFIVQNFSRHGHGLIHAFEQISLPVFMVYFMTQAANLDLQAVSAYLPLTAILVLARAGTLYGSIRWATHIADASPDSKRYLWMGFFSKGGVDLVLAGIVAARIGGWGVEFQTVITASVVVYIVSGPPLLKYALDRVGETETARQTARAVTESIDPSNALEALSIPSPRFADARLQHHVEALRVQLNEVAEQRVLQPTAAALEVLAGAADALRALATDAQSALSLSPSDPERFTRLRAVLTRHRETSPALFGPISSPTKAAAVYGPTREGAEGLLNSIHRMEPFNSAFKVACEPHVFEVRDEDGKFIRAVRRGRRLRRRLLGAGYRLVPLGRLWRYFISMSIPERLATSPLTPIAQSWQVLGALALQIEAELTRALAAPPTTSTKTPDEDDAFNVLQALSKRRQPVLGNPDTPLDPHHASDPHHPTDPEHPPDTSHPPDSDHTPDTAHHGVRLRLMLSPKSPAPKPDDPLRYWLSELDQTQAAAQRLIPHLRGAFASAFQELINAILFAGLIELPAFRYRPSARFDAARAAREQWLRQIERQREITKAWRDEGHVEQSLVRFQTWYETYTRSVTETLDRFTSHSIPRQLDRLRSLFPAPSTSSPKPLPQNPPPTSDLPASSETTSSDSISPPPDDPDETKLREEWRARLLNHFTPVFRVATRDIEQARARVQYGGAVRRHINDLESQIERFPESSSLYPSLSKSPPQNQRNNNASPNIEDVPVRRWFHHELEADLTVVLAESQERTRQTLKHALVELERCEQVLQLHICPPEGRPEGTTRLDYLAFVETGLKRALNILDQLSASQIRTAEETRTWISTQFHRRFKTAIDPLVAHDFEHMRAELARRQRAPLPSPAGLKVAIRKAGTAIGEGLQRAVIRPLTKARKGFAALLTGENRHLADARPFVTSLERIERDVPSLYRRLYSPLPVELESLRVAMNANEQSLSAAVERWRLGEEVEVLIHGDPGSGISSLIADGLARWSLEVPVHRVTPLSVSAKEREWMRALTPEGLGGLPGTIEDLSLSLSRSEGQRVIVFEHAERFLSRTAEGISRLRRLMQMFALTRGQILWIVTMRSASLGFFEQVAHLRSAFSDVIEMQPLPTDQLEQLILMRHELSNYQIEFLPPQNDWTDRVSKPLASAEAARSPASAWFKRATKLSGGNPRYAIYLWLGSLEAAGDSVGKVRVGALPERMPLLLDGLSKPALLVATALACHGDVELDALPSIVHGSRELIERALTELDGALLLDRSAPARMRRLHPAVAFAVTRELRANNLIAATQGV